ncbi:MAG TPA: SRPBCC family protein [Thermoplasmata archaeon]|nr:SRPBCC family protein [Thermoplasmata archaeon]
MTQWPAPEYRVRQEFDAPLDFVFRWCTDYSGKDAALEGEGYERRVLSRTSRRVIFEDLASDREGWIWRRYTVRLSPPYRWHAESVGNRRLVVVDYQLTALPGNRTRLEYTWRRKGLGAYRKNPSKRSGERDSSRGWQQFARALERDYRNSQQG